MLDTPLAMEGKIKVMIITEYDICIDLKKMGCANESLCVRSTRGLYYRCPQRLQLTRRLMTSHSVRKYNNRLGIHIVKSTV